MQKVINKLRKNEGYVSIETIIVSGLLIGLGALAVSAFQNSADGITTRALNQVEGVQNNYDALKITKNS